MAITQADFNKIWASTSPLTPYEFSENNYKQGWNFIGGTPPSRQMWDFLQKNNDEKMQYLADNYLPLSGGTMSGILKFSVTESINRSVDDSFLVIRGGNGNGHGSAIVLDGMDRYSSGLGGSFTLYATNGTDTKALQGMPNGKLTWDGQPLLPIGIVQAFAGNTIPNGWLLCDGSAVSRTDYADLYSVIGNTYGAGDGSTTFNVPNLIDKFVQGNATAGTVKSAGLPDITGDFKTRKMTGAALITLTDGSFSQSTDTDATSPVGVGSGNPGSDRVTFKASDSNGIYGNSNTVQPPALTMKYIIKY